MRQGVEGAGIVMVAVGAPPTPDGEADLTQVRQAVGEALLHAGPDVVIAIKSTIPPGSTRARAAAIARKDVAFVMCPEFLRRAPRCTTSGIPAASLGGEDSKARLRVAALFDGLDAVNLLCDSTSAELIKYSSNAFLATKISFINEMAQLCELTGADID